MARPRYEMYECDYEGKPGPEWVAFLEAKQAEGWQWVDLRVVRQLDGGRFLGRTKWRREVKP